MEMEGLMNLKKAAGCRSPADRSRTIYILYDLLIRGMRS
jgi:hypothetical protein